MLLPEFNKYWIPSRVAPLAVIRLAGPLMGVPRDLIDASHSKWCPQLDNSRAQNDLGLRYSDLREATLSMARKIVDLGMVKRK